MNFNHKSHTLCQYAQMPLCKMHKSQAPSPSPKSQCTTPNPIVHNAQMNLCTMPHVPNPSPKSHCPLCKMHKLKSSMPYPYPSPKPQAQAPIQILSTIAHNAPVAPVSPIPYKLYPYPINALFSPLKLIFRNYDFCSHL